MRIALRADASPAIGFGHVARCLAIGEALVQGGHAVALIGAQLPEAMEELAAQLGVTHIAISEVSPHTDAEASVEAFSRWGGADVCLVDHHGLGREWEALARTAGSAVAVVDDLGRSHDCDLLVDANAGVKADRYRGRVDPTTWMLLGPRYAMLRRSFRKEHLQAEIRKQLKHVLVSYGGTDPTGETAKAIEALERIQDVVADVAVTSSHPQFERVRALAASAPRLRLHVDRSDLERLLAGADLVLGAAGISALERACLGVPSIATVVADNQAASAAALADAGALLLIGEAAAVTPARLRAAVDGLLACPDALARMSARGLALVDGLGAARVAAALVSLRFDLRRAVAGDAQALFDWRNHPLTRAFSLDPRPLDWERHRRWLAERLSDTSCDLLLASDDAGPVGVLRFDLSGTAATISVYLVPQRQGNGMGAPLLRAGERWLHRNRPQVRELRASVLESNAASLRVFAEAGYEGVRRDLIRAVPRSGLL